MNKLWNKPLHNLAVGQHVRDKEDSLGTITMANPYSRWVKVQWGEGVYQVMRPQIVHVDEITPV